MAKSPMTKKQLSKHYGIALSDIEKAVKEGAPVLLPSDAFVHWIIAQRGVDHDRKEAA
ncbi:hypothetical protein [Bradyrhizobium cosmicum]|uniref:Uncharacterized protein n=1 Tax=Bradyrhizobium cosmicum TaxID=1404864 RepID=A0AAI8M894_9BRAD|nr:hypothetical protein [Bradyrhizobium cosmicum]BAL73739.1 hypothetical protein S23_05180 [Bradyrhizobium cosmicum]